ncbi:hypothetical protein EOI86_08030 [Hwanghaeella grinnelliae]|uniref:DUF4231 domain-containing protein n=1 Tax=Hwanghaeella grinnelliae TaxID=2500179 RepID=A0A3S2VQC7_9PROT|nr:hypothetical protein [Hwanghaeella grinnelliae]RVU39185.1 hypothetical protein EOI86_08030 [Hwanghaeella grinnelliae]
MRAALFIISFLFLTAASAHGAPPAECNSHDVRQTSAELIFKYSRCLAENADGEASKKHLLVTDIYVKAWSYSLINKIFFWFSITAAGLVVLWPSASVVLKKRIEEEGSLQWIRSPVLQTTITGLAALSFALYAQYKDQQTSAETLMRDVFFSTKDVEILAQSAAKELARIDRGFNFGSTLDRSDK